MGTFIALVPACGYSFTPTLCLYRRPSLVITLYDLWVLPLLLLLLLLRGIRVLFMPLHDVPLPGYGTAYYHLT
ncbi:hypothetical protein LZ32DRAFT_609284 [Colletotrichum eremochloae]|nr:hypothetical protein LZ32DRAFT_609284 [Colletotrichum eremochloae]